MMVPSDNRILRIRKLTVGVAKIPVSLEKHLIKHVGELKLSAILVEKSFSTLGFLPDRTKNPYPLKSFRQYC